jgi:hypothetical protein
MHTHPHTLTHASPAGSQLSPKVLQKRKNVEELVHRAGTCRQRTAVARDVVTSPESAPAEGRAGSPGSCHQTGGQKQQRPNPATAQTRIQPAGTGHAQPFARVSASLRVTADSGASCAEHTCCGCCQPGHQTGICAPHTLQRQEPHRRRKLYNGHVQRHHSRVRSARSFTLHPHACRHISE